LPGVGFLPYSSYLYIMIKVIRDEDLAAMSDFDVLLDKYVKKEISLDDLMDGIDALELAGYFDKVK